MKRLYYSLVSIFLLCILSSYTIYAVERAESQDSSPNSNFEPKVRLEDLNGDESMMQLWYVDDSERYQVDEGEYETITKTVTQTRSGYHTKNYVYRDGSWELTGTDNSNLGSSISYSEGGFSGTLSRQSSSQVGDSDSRPSSPEEGDTGSVTENWEAIFSGTVSKAIWRPNWVWKGNFKAFYKGYKIENDEIVLNYGDSINMVKDPVNIVTGNFFSNNIDLFIDGLMPISIERSYNSLSHEIGLLGKGWRLNYESSLLEDNEGNVTIKYPDGHAVTFRKQEMSYIPPSTVKEELTKKANGSYELVFKNKIEYTYSNDGKLVTINDKNNNQIQVLYNLSNNITRIQNTGNQHLDLQITNGKVSRIEDDKGRFVAYTYQGDDLTSIQTNKGTKTYTYNHHGITSASDYNGNTYITNQYDEFGRVIHQVDGAGDVTAYEYNEATLMNKHTTQSTGDHTNYTFDLNFNVTKKEFVDGTTELYTFDSMGNKKSITNRKGYTITFNYDERGNMLSITSPDPFNYQTQFTYDGDNNLTKIQSPDGGEQVFVYDEHSNIIEKKHKLDENIFATTLFTYDDFGRVLTSTNPEGHKTTYTYNDKNKLPVSISDPENNEIGYGYDTLGRIETITTSYGTTTLTYDQGDNITKITDSLGNTTKMTYDAEGNLIKTISPEQYNETTNDGQGYTYSYDKMDKLIKQADPLGNIFKIQYDTRGNKTKEINPNTYNPSTDDGQGITYQYDMQNRKIKIINPSGKKTRIKYDALGNIIKTVDANNYIESTDSGKGMSYNYDQLNRLTQITNPEGTIIQKFIYDKMGRIIKEIDAEGYQSASNDDQRYGTLYQYNLAGWLIEKRAPLKKENNEIYYNLTIYTYDQLGRVISEQKSNEYVTKISQPSTYNRINYTYDKNNRITQITDTQGASIEYTYDALGKITNQRTKLADNKYQEIGYTYDKLGRVITRYMKLHKDDLGQDYSSEEDASGYIKAVTTYEYDKNGNITKVITPEGYSTIFTHDVANRLISKTEEVMKNTIDQTHVKLEVTSPKKKIYEDQTYTYKITLNTEENIKNMNANIQYDPRIYKLVDVTTTNDQLNIVTNQLGQISITGDDLDLLNKHDLGEIILKTKKDITGIGYITINPTSNYTDDEGNIKSFTELVGQSQTLKGPDMNDDGTVQTDDFTLTALKKGMSNNDQYFEFKYDINGDNTVGTDDLDYITNWIFEDKTKNSTQLDILQFNLKHTNVQYEKGEEIVLRTTNYNYDKAGNLIAETDAEGNQITYKYDLLGNLIKLIDKEGNTYRYIYDDVGNVIKKITPENYKITTDNGVATTYTYDTMNRLTTITNEEGNVVQKNVYNAIGQLVKQIDGENYYLGSTDTSRSGITYTYDIGGRITHITTPKSKDLGKKTVSYAYDASTNITTHTDGEGNTTTYERDLWGRATKKINAKGIIEEYTYDDAGNITSTKDGNGHLTQYTYTMANQLKRVIDPEGNSISYKYDKQGRLIKQKDKQGQTINYQYNGDNNLTKKWINGTLDQEEYLYNQNGSLLAAINKNGISQYTYTQNNQVQTKTFNDEQTLTYDYNKNGQIEKITNHEQQQTNYTYDAVGRLKTVGDKQDILANYTYNQDSTLNNITYNNNVTTTYTYDKNNNITNLIHKNNQDIINSYSYTYDNNDNIISQTKNGQKTTYTYDELSQLIMVENPSTGTETYSYDNAGNRLTKTHNGLTSNYTYNTLNQLTALEENDIITSYEYDLNGNMTKEVKEALETSYTYNGFNQLTKILQPDGSWQKNIYDSLGLRNAIVENGIHTNFINNGANVIAETDIHNNITKTNIIGYSLLASKDQVGRNYFYLQNAHTDVIGIVDQSGKIKNTYNYDAFGNIIDSTQQISNRYTYAGEQYDKISGHYYLRARYYNPSVGRFMQKDSFRGDGLNLYAYVQNNPINYIDPSGYCKEKGGSNKQKGSSNIGKSPYIHQLVGSTQHMLDGGGSNSIDTNESIYSAIENFIVGMSASVADNLLHSSKNNITVVTSVLEVLETQVSNMLGLDSRYSVLMDDLTREITNAFDQSSEGIVNAIESKYVDDYETYYLGREIADFAIAGVGFGLAGKGLYETVAGSAGIFGSIFGTIGTGGAGAAIAVPSLGASMAAVTAGVAETGIGWNIGKYAYDNGWKNNKKREAYSYWNKETEFNNIKVYQRDDLIDPNLVDKLGRTNLERMKKGLAPIGPDGKSVNLHHMTQTNKSAIVEVTQSLHKENHGILHINPNTIPSGINRKTFNKWRTSYWKNRALDF